MNLRLAVILLLGFVAFGCVSIKPGYYSDDQKRAEKTVAEYHDAYNRGAYSEIFEASHPDAKATKSKEKLEEVLREINSQLGKVVGSTLVKADVSTVNIKERQVEMVYRTQFEKGERNEIFLIVSDDSTARLHSLGLATDAELKAAEENSANNAK